MEPDSLNHFVIGSLKNEKRHFSDFPTKLYTHQEQSTHNLRQNRSNLIHYTIYVIAKFKYSYLELIQIAFGSTFTIQTTKLPTNHMISPNYA